MNSRSTLLLEHHLKELKLPSFLREYDKMAAQCAAEGVDHPQYLLRLVELELIDRHQRMVERRIRAARFPAVKTLDSFDFTVVPSVNKALVMELARCEYVQHRENVIAVGNSGTGKTHVALGLGLAACQKGMSVGFTTAAALVHELMEARDERRLLSLYETFPAPEARRIAKRLEFHYTPKHGSWLNMAEIEFSVLSRSCLKQRLPDEETLHREVQALVKERNAAQATIQWRFNTQDARTKLHRLYPFDPKVD